jgi:hypothetical protein
LNLTKVSNQQILPMSESSSFPVATRRGEERSASGSG